MGYELYLRTLETDEAKRQLDNAELFQQCLNLNRSSLRTLNCGERKKKLDNFIENSSDNFSEFKEKISADCAPQISKYLSSKFNLETTSNESTLYQRLNNEIMVDINMKEVLDCLKL